MPSAGILPGVPPVEMVEFFHTVLLNTVVFGAAWRFVGRRGVTDPVQRWMDVLLLCFAVQYVSVGVTGLVGMMSGAWVGIVALLISVALASPKPVAFIATRSISNQSRLIFTSALLFVCGYVGMLVWVQRALPPTSNDVLTYHLPAAVTWMQAQRFELFQTWFYNPANTYSPLAGSVFAAWWMLPAHDDTFARFVQVWPWVGVFAGAVHLTRSVVEARWRGAGDQPRTLAIACLIGAAVVLSRPIISQATVAKDDLYALFFFLCVVGTIGRPGLSDRLAPWRVGLALGLMLATKYTALMTLVLLIVALDAPLRAWRWKQWGVALGCVLVLAGPWYVRNWVQFGNPIFPQRFTLMGTTILPGLIDLKRSEALTSLQGVWRTLCGAYHSLPPVTAGAVMLGWVGLIVSARRAILRDPLLRLAVVGSAGGVLLFVMRSPYAEFRFVYPSMVLMFCGAGAGCVAMGLRASVAGAMVLCALSVLTGFNALGNEALSSLVMQFVLSGVALAGLGLVLKRLPRAARAAGVIGAGAVLVVMVAINGSRFVESDQDAEIASWRDTYADSADVWDMTRTFVPAGATLAYTNTFLVHPLYGPGLSRTLVYAPVVPGVRRLADLAPVPDAVSGEQLIPQVVMSLTRDPDEQTWLDHLRQTGATHLLVMKNQSGIGLADSPIELTWARKRFPVIASVRSGELFDLDLR